MCLQGVKLDGPCLRSAARRSRSRGGLHTLALAPRGLAAAVAALATIALHASPLRAEGAAIAPTSPTVDCPNPVSQDLVMPPELVSAGGILKGTVNLTEEFQRLPTSVAGVVTCAPQLVRIFRGEGLPPAPPAQPPAPNMADPIPGPTLRARLGDLVQLTFVNQVNSNRFDRNIDLDACMRVGQGGQLYPGTFDTPPNCLHASSTANIHFHGTHTNPNSTGDNVYLQIRPLPRNNQGVLTTTPAAASVSLDDFFRTCSEQLKNPLNPWPATWSQLPKPWVDKQTELLQAFQAANPSQALWTEDQKVLNAGGWPQYYIGVVPYCFALPAFTAPVWTPSSSPNMGQAPGTHWYHAHKHGSTAINVANGMTGVFIIEGPYDDDLNANYGVYVLKDGKAWNTRSQPILVLNQLGTTPNLLTAATVAGDPPGVDFVVNGRLRPKVQMQPGEVQLWRIANTSGRNAAYFMAPEGLEWRQLAQDGVQLANGNYRNSLNKPFYLAPGNRVDLLVKAPLKQMTADILVQNVMGRSQVKPTPAAPNAGDPKPGFAIMSVNVSGDPVMRDGKPAQMQFLGRAPTQPVFLQDISEQELWKSNYSGKKFEFNSKTQSPMQHTINNIQFQDNLAVVHVMLGAVEEWKISNSTNTAVGPGIIDHPFHIHINPFQIPEVFDPNQNLVDPKTGQLEAVLDPVSKTTTAVPRYVTDPAILKDPNNPFAKRQCFLDPKNKATWSVTGACGPQPPQTNLIWWDVFAIPSARVAPDGTVIPGYFTMRSRFVDYAGLYVLHCHILVHEDRGMMFSVQVMPRTPILLQHH
jgi:FtsP/CotA-like multicopper oxidase with cupredoxin domain